MDPLFFLVGALVFLALLFLGFIVLLWGLKQLLTIKNQNDEMIYLLEQISMGICNEASVQTRLQEDIGKDNYPGTQVRAA